jgi:toxin YoeB
MRRTVRFHADGFDDYVYWSENDLSVLRKINSLIKEVCRTPFVGSGKPETLKHEWRGYWSRHITGEHRLSYKATDTEVVIAECRYHYK